MTCVVKKTIFKDNVCRLCASIAEKMVYIFDYSGCNVSRVIKQCFPSLGIEENDDKPKQICHVCNVKLNELHEFMTRCLESDIKFDSYIEQRRKQEENCSITDCVWTDAIEKDADNDKTSVSEEGVIVLSNADPSIKSGTMQDYVVTIEVKYKDNLPDITEITPVTTSATIVNDISTSIESFTSSATKVNILSSSDTLENKLTVCDSIITYKKVDSGRETLETELNKPSGSCDINLQSNALPENKKKCFECSVCHQIFLRRTRLNSHMACHTDVRPYVCPTCGKSFPMKWYLNLHQRIHSRTFACQICEKAFDSKGKLERHSRVHTGERPFICSYCGKGFGEKRNLDNHIRTHTGERPYLCPICCKGFSVRSHATDHLAVHKLKPAFECLHCNKKFKWKNNWKRHLKSHKTN